MRASPPAVPEWVAPASRQSKWAGPRVSALGAALATAPFLVWAGLGSNADPARGWIKDAEGPGGPVHGTIHLGAGPVSVTQTKIEAADDLAHQSKAVAAMSKTLKTAAAM
jgi:hypothetical protein